GKGTVQKARNRKNAAHVSLSSQYHITNLSKNTQSQKPRRTKRDRPAHAGLMRYTMTENRSTEGANTSRTLHLRSDQTVMG
ncbi:hypothetical protein, partial [Fulvimarina sp. MAC3]|uniref:hypothetical protein n=1 Tax=Fulvimarina sp. MAC3 TaxID=3148887 RepID=UPI0031FCC3DD